MNKYRNLLSSYSKDDFVISNRIVLPPLTRCTASVNQVPTENIKQFYLNRADCGLLVTEATCVSADANGYPNTPGIYSDEQIKAWKEIVTAVKQSGNKFFMQVWHAGMFGHSCFRNGNLPLSPSGIKPLKELLPRTRIHYEIPAIMDEEDIREVKDNFVNAAINAINLAGFDGIELHAANGYLLSSFMHYSTNKRLDEYGGSPENMCRFVLDIIHEIASALGSYKKIAIRISPSPPPAMESLVEVAEDRKVYKYLLSELNKLDIAYIHICTDNDRQDRGCYDMRISEFVRSNYKGTLIIGGNFTIDEAEEAIENNKAEMVYFGKILIANPSLVKMIKSGEVKLRELTPDMILNPPIKETVPLPLD